ncbi:MAG: DNA polymerase III subunit delta' [Betaproteobacteria bacterium]|nr:DNA polymerase III subunit delta' [Betaproteobacteria bacterium]
MSDLFVVDPVSRLHPWNRARFRQLTADPAHMPHAILLSGAKGVGKLELALELARWLLCQRPHAEGACGDCDACNWFDQGNHPDFRRVEPKTEDEAEEGVENEAKPKTKPKKGARPIPVEAVREVTEFLNLSSHRGGWRVALFHPAEAMNAAAANALLKTLEEPPERVLLLLVSHQPGRLLPTVLSRCRQVAIPLPPKDQALVWLEAQAEQAAALLAEAGGAPLAALAFADPERLELRQAFLAALAAPARLDAAVVAETYGKKNDPALAWGWLSRWLMDLLHQRLAGALRYFPEQAPVLARLAAQADLSGLLALQREVSGAGFWLRHPLNHALLLESWLIRYIETMRAKA